MSAYRNIAFNGYALQTTNIICDTIDTESGPNMNVKSYELAHGNSTVIPYVSWPSRTIKVSGYIFSDTAMNLDNLLDTFRGYFIGTNKNLDIDWGSSTRRFIATLNTISIVRPGGLQYATFDLEFLCSLPFGALTTATTALNGTGRTLATYSDTYTFLGTAPYQTPVITITYSALSASGAQSVSVGNNLNGQQITVTRTWAANDVLVIDTTQNTVTVNGLAVDFSGAFPTFPPGSQTIGYTDSFTSRTMTYNITYNQLYL